MEPVAVIAASSVVSVAVGAAWVASVALVVMTGTERFVPALAFGQLAPLGALLDRRSPSGEPVWWRDFEGRYVARGDRCGRCWRSRAIEPEARVERSES